MKQFSEKNELPLESSKDNQQQGKVILTRQAAGTLQKVMKGSIGGAKEVNRRMKCQVLTDKKAKVWISDYTILKIFKREAPSWLYNVSILANFLGFETVEAKQIGYVDVVPIDGDAPYTRYPSIKTEKTSSLWIRGYPLQEGGDPDRVIKIASQESFEFLQEGELVLAYDANRRVAESYRLLEESFSELKFRTYCLSNARHVGRVDLIRRTLHAIEQVFTDEKLLVNVTPLNRSSVLTELGSIASDFPPYHFDLAMEAQTRAVQIVENTDRKEEANTKKKKGYILRTEIYNRNRSAEEKRRNVDKGLSLNGDTYEIAIERDEPDDVSNAILQMAMTFEVDRKYDEILGLFNYSVNKDFTKRASKLVRQSIEEFEGYALGLAGNIDDGLPAQVRVMKSFSEEIRYSLIGGIKFYGKEAKNCKSYSDDPSSRFPPNFKPEEQINSLALRQRCLSRKELRLYIKMCHE